MKSILALVVLLVTSIVMAVVVVSAQTKPVVAVQSNIPPEAEMSEGATKEGFTLQLYFVGSKIVGEKLFHRNGALQRETLYDGDRTTKHGEEREWAENGTLICNRPYIKGRLNGIVRQWSSKGDLLGSCVLINGTGSYCEWYDNNQIKVQGGFRDGDKDGLWVHYYPSGQVEKMSLFEKNRQVGVNREWYSNGLPVLLQFYSDGKYHGFWMRWENNGGVTKGYPHYYVNSKEVEKIDYDRAAEEDISLPPSSLCADKSLYNVFMRLTSTIMKASSQSVSQPSSVMSQLE